MADIIGGAWEWMAGFRGWCAGDHGSFSRHWELIYGDEETPEGAAHSYATYVLGISMGILTNIVLELVLVCRVHLLGGVPGGPSPLTLKVLRWAVWCQLAPLAVFMIVMSEPVRKSNVAAPSSKRRLTQVLAPVRLRQEFAEKRRTRRRVR